MKNNQHLRKGDVIKSENGLYFVVTGLYRRFGYVLGTVIVNNKSYEYNTRIKTDNFTKVQCIRIIFSVNKIWYDIIRNRVNKVHTITLQITKQSEKLLKIDNSKDCIIKFYVHAYYPRYVKVLNVQKSLCSENKLFLTYENI